MYRYLRHFGLLTLLTLTSAMTTHAALINPSDSIENLDLRWGKNESNFLQAFDESQHVALQHNQVNVDYLVGQNLDVGSQFRGVNRSNSQLTLSAGKYSSHLIHFDPNGTKSGSFHNARFSFKDNIVAIILGGEYLNASDVILGVSTTRYEKSTSRKMETGDRFFLENSHTLMIDKVGVGRYWVDDVRVITESVPEPGSWALFGMGLICLIGARKVASKQN